MRRRGDERSREELGRETDDELRVLRVGAACAGTTVLWEMGRKRVEKVSFTPDGEEVWQSEERTVVVVSGRVVGRLD